MNEWVNKRLIEGRKEGRDLGNGEHTDEWMDKRINE